MNSLKNLKYYEDTYKIKFNKKYNIRDFYDIFIDDVLTIIL